MDNCICIITYNQKCISNLKCTIRVKCLNKVKQKLRVLVSGLTWTPTFRKTKISCRTWGSLLSECLHFYVTVEASVAKSEIVSRNLGSMRLLHYFLWLEKSD